MEAEGVQGRKSFRDERWMMLTLLESCEWSTEGFGPGRVKLNDGTGIRNASKSFQKQGNA